VRPHREAAVTGVRTRARVRAMTEQDVEPGARVMAAAFGQDGSDGWVRQRQRRRIAHLLGTDPGGSLVAEHHGRIVGLAQAYVREELWCLSMLAVDPQAQSTGAGRALFDGALGYGGGGPGLIVSSNDPRALRLYAAAGFSLRPALKATGMIDRRALPTPCAEVRRGGLSDLPAIAAISRSVRGAAHSPEIAFALGRGAQLLVLENRGFVVAEPGVGVFTLAARDEEAASALLWSGLSVVGDVAEPVRWITGGQDWAVDVVLRAGLQVAAYGALCVRGRPGPLRPFVPSPPFA
jgi:ribosomal protein S18 acetylase RimI-like enzyme